MSTTKFTTMSFPVSTLLGQIEMGLIGLPELQRPFVWDRAQVRDLLDSLYRGYPAGYFLLWLATQDVGALHIGADGKQANPSLLVVDGQQRLTSLYAVFKGAPVLTEKFDRVHIRIAFNPVRERFEVSNSATLNDPEWIDDVSPLLSGAADSFSFINAYLEQLAAERELLPDVRSRIASNLQRLVSLNSYPFTAIQLSYDLPIEEVAEIFVRVNSKGTQLDQADFILTLMSVYWDKGRKELEEFCQRAKVPASGHTPFNWFIEPKPDQLLRVAVGLGHRRARLKYAYELLRGKNLETGELSEEARKDNFERLKVAQAQVLDLTNFSEYLKALQEAGFRSGRMITSNNTIVYSYLIFLIGRCDYGLDFITLRKAVARWFMMCVLTSRYTGSPESQVEKDIRRFAEAQDGQQFLATIDQTIAANLTTDFWDVTLPDLLAYSGGYIPAMFAYYAALNLLGAKVLFSTMTVHQLLDPAAHGKKNSIERHHLFPKGYLATQGITGSVRTNRVANYALVEWPDNITISDKPPAEYFPALFAERVPPGERDRVRFWHALPEGWELMDYDTFTAERQRLLAQVIKAGFEKLATGADPTFAGAIPDTPPTVDELVAQGESLTVEFKGSLVHSYRPDVPAQVIVGSVVKTIAALLNSEGGTLAIGVDDDGNTLGIEPDLALKGFNLDNFENFLVTTLSQAIDPVAATRCRIRFEQRDGKQVCLVDVERSSRPVYADTDKGKRLFYVRAGNTTRILETKDAVNYIADRFGIS
jgi:hypothetical protein